MQMVTINTNIICSGNYTDINYSIEYQSVILESGNERISYASLQRENDQVILQAKAELIAAKELYYSDKDLDALKAKKEAENLYNEKYAKHHGFRWYMYCDYDIAFMVPELKVLIDYLTPRKGFDVLDFTITTVHNEDGTYWNKGEIYSHRIADSEWQVINAFPDVIKGIEDLNDFIPE